MDWQLIETAPRDGTSILLWDGRSVFEGGWFDSWYGDESGACWMAANLDEEYGAAVFPTHWQPLPPPPNK